MADMQASNQKEGQHANVGNHSRRAFVGAVFAGTSASALGAHLVPLAAVKGGMKIERFELTNPGRDVPRISYAIARGDMVYTSGVTPHLAGDDLNSAIGDVKAQTHQVLAKIDQLLAMAGSNKSKLISAQVWLTDMRNFTAHCEAWNEWVDHDNPPVRACLLSPELWATGMLVEIMVTAAR